MVSAAVDDPVESISEALTSETVQKPSQLTRLTSFDWIN